LPVEEAHRDAFWVIAVVGGMSIAKAIEDSLGSISVAHWTAENAVILPRFFLFLLTSVRFFIGSNVFFQTVHLEKEHQKAFPRRNYSLDFGSAIFHFSILYALAVNIKTIPTGAVFISNELFFLFLSAVLLYDWAWYFASAGYDTAPFIKKWAWYNTLAVFIPCAGLAFLFKQGNIDRSWFEILLAGWISITSLPDLIAMAHGEMPKP
jgi:hypothetical protein